METDSEVRDLKNTAPLPSIIPFLSRPPPLSDSTPSLRVQPLFETPQTLGYIPRLMGTSLLFVSDIRLHRVLRFRAQRELEGLKFLSHRR